MTFRIAAAGGLAGVLMLAVSPASAQQTTGAGEQGAALPPPIESPDGTVTSPDPGAAGADPAMSDPGLGATTVDPAAPMGGEAGAIAPTAPTTTTTVAADPALTDPVESVEEEDDGFDLGWLGLAGLLGLLGLRRKDPVETHRPTATTTTR